MIIVLFISSSLMKRG